MGGSEETKIFVGGLSQETTKESLTDHFSKYGGLSDAVVMYDTASGRSRGFGFVTFETSDCIASVLATSQTVDGKEVDCKRACPRESMAAKKYESLTGSGEPKTTKVFVGGLPDLTTDEFKAYFGKYGKVVDAVLMTDRSTNRPRGFGFITYESTDVVDEVVRQYHDHQIKDKWVEVKRAQTRDQLGGGRGGMHGGRDPSFGGGCGGPYGPPPYGGFYEGYRPGSYPVYDHRRPPYGGGPGGGVGYNPYASGPPHYAGGGYPDGGGRRSFAAYGPNRGGSGGPFRTDPYAPPMAGGYGPPAGGGYGLPHPAGAPPSYGGPGYGGGGGYTQGCGGNISPSACNGGSNSYGGQHGPAPGGYGMRQSGGAADDGNPYSNMWITDM
eukprot:GHVQ01005124.1.p1 GENE.GHVQ01005124.1~~GHVQ01005124.1.p1  ORF type:complete len:382 (+),score=55.41 GHVQ01005124.1:73-1218(+)